MKKGGGGGGAKGDGSAGKDAHTNPDSLNFDLQDPEVVL